MDSRSGGGVRKSVKVKKKIYKLLLSPAGDPWVGEAARMRLLPEKEVENLGRAEYGKR